MAMADVIHMPEHRGPQLEGGYMRVANELAEAITYARLSAYQRGVLDVVMRQTYGYNKLIDDIARTQFVWATGIDASSVRRAINDLVEMGIVIQSGGRHARSYSVNKRHSTWEIEESRKLCNRAAKEGVINPLSGGDLPPLQGVINPLTGGDSPPTKDNSKRHSLKTTPKDNLSGSLREPFEKFWNAYPKKKSRATAEKAFAKLQPNEQLLDDLMTGLERAMTSRQWSDPQFIPYAASWLTAAGWKDVHQSEYSAAERAVIQAYNQALGEQNGIVNESVFVESRAGAIRFFVAHRPQDPDFWKRYFPWVEANVDMPPATGFDWLISPKGFSNVTGGQHAKRRGAVGAGGAARGHWSESAPGVDAKGAELGLAKRDGEDQVTYRRRVFKKAGPGPWREADLAAEAKFGGDAYERLYRFYNGGAPKE